LDPARSADGIDEFLDVLMPLFLSTPTGVVAR
jgi:hypothetical protein